MNEITNEYRVNDSTNASPMIIGTKSWLVLLGLRPIDSIAEAASSPDPSRIRAPRYQYRFPAESDKPRAQAVAAAGRSGSLRHREQRAREYHRRCHREPSS